jgi:hypothetical protein
MGVRVSAPTVQKILEENGFGPPGADRTRETYTSAAKDALWAVDFFVMRTLRGQLLQLMIVVDVCTRELLLLRAYDGWDVDSTWTMRTLAWAMSETGRTPTAVMHDRAPQLSSTAPSPPSGALTATPWLISKVVHSLTRRRRRTPCQPTTVTPTTTQISFDAGQISRADQDRMRRRLHEV